MTTRKNTRRHFMLAAGAATVGASVIGCAPSHPRGAAMPVDIGGLPEGVLRVVEWEGRPVWILRRTAAQVGALADNEGALADPHSLQSLQADTCRNQHRSLRKDLFVAIGLCTHEGCTPALRAGSGFLCPCHASRFDLAGRVAKAGPAPSNLVIPAYRFEGPDQLVVGVED